LSVNVIPMSDLTLVSMDKASKLFPEYPHIFFADASDEAITNPVINDYEKYKFVFRNQIMMPASGWLMDDVLDMAKTMIGAKKIAILWEDSSYTKGWRDGMPSLGIPKMSEYAKSKYGLDVVLEKSLQWRSGMYLPVLELCNMNGAEAILYNAGPSSDIEVFTKQWAQSSARDITPIYWWGGPQHSKAFWKLTGGMALGSIGVYADHDIPITNKTIPFNQKCRAQGALIATTTATAYEDVYFMKAAIEKVGNTKDINAIIKELEGKTVIEGVSANKCYFTGERIAPFFHSREIVDPKNPMKHILNSYCFGFVQWLGDDKVTYVSSKAELPQWADYANYKKPADLRAAAGIK
jgi:ABC-type branched-subunit amino acid transport system substrate-binding protein